MSAGQFSREGFEIGAALDAGEEVEIFQHRHDLLRDIPAVPGDHIVHIDDSIILLRVLPRRYRWPIR